MFVTATGQAKEVLRLDERILAHRVVNGVTRIAEHSEQLILVHTGASHINTAHLRRVEEGGRLLVGERPRLGVVWLRHTRPLVLPSDS